MRYSLFEQAAAEANLGKREIEAQLDRISTEIEHLNAKKALLKAVSSQLLMLVPVNSHSGLSDGSSQPGPSAEAPAPAPPPSSDATAEADPALPGALERASTFPLREEIREAWLSRP